MRFGDIYPDSWNSNDKFQNAFLVTDRLWENVEEKLFIWSQKSRNSNFVHIYLYSGETGKYLCSYCSSENRYSQAKPVRLESGEIGLFEYQEHLFGCRLPLRLFENRKRANNVVSNGSRGNTSLISIFNGSNLINNESLECSRFIPSNVNSLFHSGRRHDNHLSLNSLMGPELENNQCSTNSSPFTPLKQCSTKACGGSNFCHSTPRKSASNFDPHAFGLNSEAFGNDGSIEDPLIAEDSQLDGPDSPDVRTSVRASTLASDNDSKSVENADSNNSITSIINLEDFEQEKLPNTRSFSVSTCSKASTSNDCFKSSELLEKSYPAQNDLNSANSLKITGRKWEMSKDGRFLWCQHEKNPTLWYFYQIFYNEFICFKCDYNGRRSAVKLLVENDGTKSLVGVENHFDECGRNYDDVIQHADELMSGRITPGSSMLRKSYSMFESINLERENEDLRSGQSTQNVSNSGCEAEKDVSHLNTTSTSNLGRTNYEECSDVVEQVPKKNVDSVATTSAVSVEDDSVKAKNDLNARKRKCIDDLFGISSKLKNLGSNTKCSTSSNPVTFFKPKDETSQVDAVPSTSCVSDVTDKPAGTCHLSTGAGEQSQQNRSNSPVCADVEEDSPNQNEKEHCICFDLDDDDDVIFVEERNSTNVPGKSKDLSIYDEMPNLLPEVIPCDNTTTRILQFYTKCSSLSDSVISSKQNNNVEETPDAVPSTSCVSDVTNKPAGTGGASSGAVEQSEQNGLDVDSLVVEENESSKQNEKEHGTDDDDDVIFVEERNSTNVPGKSKDLSINDEMPNLLPEVIPCDNATTRPPQNQLVDLTAPQSSQNLNNSNFSFANPIKIIGRLWRVSNDGKSILCQTNPNSNLWYLYRFVNNRFICCECLAQGRWSEVAVCAESNGEISFVGMENHSNNCAKNYDGNGNLSNLATKISEQYEISKFIWSNFSFLTQKVQNRMWSKSKNGNYVWCQSKTNPNLWNLYHKIGENVFHCLFCQNQNKYSACSFATEADGLNYLYTIEVHDENCCKTMGFIQEQVRLSVVGQTTMENHPQNQPTTTVVNDSRSKIGRAAQSVVVESGKTRIENFFGKSQQNNSSTNSQRITNRKWRESIDREYVVCQCDSTSELWFTYHKIHNNMFRCGSCLIDGRYSVVEFIIGSDGSRSLWAIENHEEKCKKKFKQIFKELYLER